MDFIASGLVEMIAGLASAAVLAGFAWWAPLVLAGAWLATHWLLRESAVWRDRNTEEVRGAQRHADYAYRLAVEPPAAKELRLFGLAGWTVERFRASRRRLFELQWQATRLRERPVAWSLVLVLAANSLVFWSLALAAADGTLALDRVVTFATAAITTSMIAFGGLSWALDGAAAPVAATLRLEEAMGPAGALAPRLPAGRGHAGARDPLLATSPSPTRPPARRCSTDFDLTIPAGSSLAIVGQNGAGKTTLAKLLCRLYDPQAGAIEVDGVDLRELDLDAWRSRVTAVFQDFIRFELPLRDNVAPAGAPDDVIRARSPTPARRACRARHDPRARLRRRHRALRRAVAARGAGASAVRRAAGRGPRAARRAHRAARRARRGRDLRPHPRRHAAHHDDPHLAPVLDRAPRRSHLRARRRPGGRARHARRADGRRRPLPHHVRPAGIALRLRRRRDEEGVSYDVLA